jgi:hypothetical protein
MKRVVIESPFAGDVVRNLAYVRACMADCLQRGEAPYASHALYTQPGVLDDLKPEERKLGIEAGFAWREAAERTVFYLDLGWSSGMKLGIEDCKLKGKPFETRMLGAPWGQRCPSDPTVTCLCGQVAPAAIGGGHYDCPGPPGSAFGATGPSSAG